MPRSKAPKIDFAVSDQLLTGSYRVRIPLALVRHLVT